jgi:hypothetical protein
VHLDGTVQVGNAAVLGGTGVFNEDLIAPPLAIDVPQLIPYSGTREALAVWHFWPYEGMSIVDPYLAIYDSAMIEIARVTYEGTFSDTDQVMIDAQTKKVIAPNETYPYENLTATNGKWIPIPVDACYYFCVNTGGSDPVGAFNLEFYETYG